MSAHAIALFAIARGQCSCNHRDSVVFDALTILLNTFDTNLKQPVALTSPRAAATDELLAPLAMALVDNPRATLQELARAVGISKATLYRFCQTREQLTQMLMEHSIETFSAVIRAAQLETAPPLEALRRLIADNLRHRELVLFLLHYWKENTFMPDGPEESEAMLDAFFLRGQQLNVFRIDIPAPALTEIWNSLWAGLVEAERRGRVARSGLPSLIESAFLKGTLAGPAGVPTPTLTPAAAHEAD